VTTQQQRIKTARIVRLTSHPALVDEKTSDIGAR
jgi:ABC-type phosphate transport system ATPase subunit